MGGWSDAARQAAALARQHHVKVATKPGSAAGLQNGKHPWQVKDEKELADAHTRAQNMANATGHEHIVVTHNGYHGVMRGGGTYEGHFRGSHTPSAQSSERVARAQRSDDAYHERLTRQSQVTAMLKK